MLGSCASTIARTCHVYCSGGLLNGCLCLCQFHRPNGSRHGVLLKRILFQSATFLEPHANGLMHHNILVRADSQYRWKHTAETLFQKYRVSVSFGNNICTWSEGVVWPFQFVALDDLRRRLHHYYPVNTLALFTATHLIRP